MNTLQNIFLREKSLENYSDGAVLELLFSTAGVRGDTQSIIESMFDTFGSFKGVLEARPAQLMKIPGVTKKVATLVSMIAPLAKVWERANMDDSERISNTRDAEAYAKSLLMAERTERFYVVALSARCKVLGCRKISEGSLSEVSAYPVERIKVHPIFQKPFLHGKVKAFVSEQNTSLMKERIYCYEYFQQPHSCHAVRQWSVCCHCNLRSEARSIPALPAV